MKKLLIFCALAIVFASCTPAFGQTQKQSLFTSSFTKKKAKILSTVDSAKRVASYLSLPSCNFREACEDQNEVRLSPEVYESFVRGGLMPDLGPLTHPVIYNFREGTIVINKMKIDLYPIFAFSRY